MGKAVYQNIFNWVICGDICYQVVTVTAPGGDHGGLDSWSKDMRLGIRGQSNKLK